MAISKILSEALGDPLQGYLFGLTMSTAGSSTTLTVAAGAACDSTGTRIMQLASSLAKTTSAWALGTAAGGLDTGSIAASTWYHWFLIQRPDTGVVDVLFSLSATAPTLPANYTLFRRIGAMKTNGSSQWTKFVQFGDEFIWDVAAADAVTAATSTTAALVTLSVPTGVQVNALTRVRLNFITNGLAFIITSPDESDQAAASGGFSSLAVSSTSTSAAGHFNTRTNTSAQIRVRANNTGPTYDIGTFGWIDSRGKLQ